jgi:hypothetical protein
MPKGPKGQKRPADVIGNAIKVARIATGEEEEDFSANDGKDKAAQSLGQRPYAMQMRGRARPRSQTVRYQ